MSPRTRGSAQKWVSGQEGSGVWWAQDDGAWTVPRIEVWINSLRKATFRKFVDE